ncbi:MAG: YbaB/EbfC family nucleoid-associated protein [Desulfobulbaceae bacterium]|nr:MAG: YbaB/EbfC family nucleoid-associated protein [Desulfobulbaceae bacterium]
MMDLNAIMQQAREMQEKMAKIQEDLAAKTITGSAGGGMVSVTATGKGDILSIAIEEELITPGEKEMLQDLITAATNDAIRKSRELTKQEMGSLTGGMQIPGLGNLF